MNLANELPGKFQARNSWFCDKIPFSGLISAQKQYLEQSSVDDGSAQFGDRFRAWSRISPMNFDGNV